MITERAKETWTHWRTLYNLITIGTRNVTFFFFNYDICHHLLVESAKTSFIILRPHTKAHKSFFFLLQLVHKGF